MNRSTAILTRAIRGYKAANGKERENVAVYKSITFDNRKKIAALYAKGMSISDISDEVGVALRTLYVELKRGATGKLDHNQRPAYDPVLAQRTYQENIRRRGSGPKRKEVKK
nr:helix-turn-helix domain-containing protein [Merdimmobilis hominis]